MKREDTEDVYRLSPVQAGMLFHAVHSAGRTMYFQQFNGCLHARDAGHAADAGFDPDAFAAAWQALVDANPTLRTGFLWQGLQDPVQVVARRAVLPVDRLDWSALPPHVQEESLRAYLAEDRRRGFDLARPPLLRLALIDLGRGAWHVVWSFHHLVLDGWSVGLLLREVPHLMARLRAGEPAAPRPRRPFKEYVAWLRRQDLGEAEAYWRQALAGFTVPTPLGIDRRDRRDRREARTGRTADEGEGYATRACFLPWPDTGAVKAFAQRHRLTLSTVAEGAWALLLSRYSREDDLVFGTTVSGRPPSLPGVEAMLGCFINTLPVRVRVPAGEPGGEVVPWLQGLQLEQAKLRRFEHSPLVEVIGWSEVPRQLPLFTSIFVFENFDAELEQTFSGVFQRTNYPLTLVFAPGEELAMRADYETARFEPAAIERLLGHLASLLAGIAAGETRLSELSPLSPAERAALLAGPAVPAPDPDALVPLHRLFAERARRSPDAVAVVCEGETLSYGELDRRAEALARRLRALGVGPEVLVGLCAERSALLVVAILGILKAGGAYLPLDPRYPDSRLALIAEDSGVDVLVATGDLRARVPGSRRAVLLDGPLAPLALDDPAGASGEALAAGGAPEVLAENLAYVIYTSGSTGRPKGSLITHANAARLFAATAGWFGFGERDVWTLFHSFAFDFSVWELWGALAHGGRLVVVPWRVSRSPADFYELLAREGVTVLSQTPSAFRQLVEAEGERGGPAPDLALDWVVFGGEALDPASLAPWYERRPEPGGDRRPRLVNMYGITETTVHVSFRRLSRADSGEPGRSPLGEPIPDLRIHVADPCGHPTPIGVAGEMLVGGAGLGRGYLGRPDLTAERFVPDPWAGGARPSDRPALAGARSFDRNGAPGARQSDLNGALGARLYRTGDLARRTEDGDLEYLGRLDHQVKIRGFRIELGEVEATLAAHPAVAAAVVLASGEGEDRHLTACVVPRAEGGAGRLDAAALRAHLLARLPEYMVPAAWVEVAALPLTAHGKVDRKSLAGLAAAAAAEQGAAAAGFVAPRTPVEELLAGIFGEVLGVERVGAEDGFFALGGHSLLAMRLLTRVRETFGVELPIEALFETPAVGELAPRIEAAWTADGRLAAPPLVASSPEGSEDLERATAPLSFAQERLWFLDQLQPGLPAYNIPAAVRLTGALDVAALQSALAEVRRRHEALRTVFAARDGRPVQVVLPAAEAPLPLADLSGLLHVSTADISKTDIPRAHPSSPGDGAGRAGEAGWAFGSRCSELARLAREEASRPFDLAAGPLLRSRLVRLGGDDHALLLTQHHIVSDGWSLGILLDELNALYAAFRAGRPSPLSPPVLQYADFARWQRSWLQGEILESRLARARERLAGVPVLQLPQDRPRPQERSFAGGARPFVLSEGLAAALQALARRERVTLFMLMLAAYQALLHRLSGQGDLAVGAPVAGRSRPEVQPLIGFFVNTLVLRSRPAGDPAFRALLAAARAEALDAYAHQDVPLERLVQELVSERDLGHEPLFQAMLSFGVPEPAATALPGLALTPFSAGFATSKFDLTLTVAGAGALAGQWVWSTALFDPGTVARWAGHFETLLAGLVADPARRLSALPLLSAAERAQLLVEWNLPRVDHPDGGYLHEMIAAQAARRPDAVGVSFEGAALSYGELMRRVGALAPRLRRLGAGPEVVVGVCGDRSPELVTAILGVLAAGAAYLPLDPALPAERLAFMLGDAGAPLVLADGRLLGSLPTGPWREVALDGLGSSPVPAPESNTEPAGLLPDHPAYVIYTSGSTGRPKGVVVSHRSLGNRVQYACAADLDEADVFLQKTTISFDVSVLEILGPLAAGGRTVLARPDGVQDPAYLVSTVLEEGVTGASFPPSLLALLCEQEGFGRCRSLRGVVTGGETVPVALPQRFYELLDADLLNRYGPTEATISVTSWVCGREESPRVLPIGRPTAGARTYLLDRALEPVPVGVVGELYLGGLCVARGYLGRPDLTAERFVPDPFREGPGALGARQDSGGAPGARLYRTGDMARYRPDGALEFAGRVDQQVKVRGFRIELGEVEAALSLHSAVREVAVVDRGEGADRTLAAYVVPVPGQAFDEDGLREHLSARLPAYMVPADFVELEAMPLTPTGKVDRQALPAPRRDGGEGYEPPQGAVEELIAGIWCDLLGRERVGRNDSFFELGGHSLLATQAVSRLREALGMELPLRRLFAAPVLSDLAEVIQAALDAASRTTALDAAPGTAALGTTALGGAPEARESGFEPGSAPGMAPGAAPGTAAPATATEALALGVSFENAAPAIGVRSPEDGIELPAGPGAPAGVGWPLSFAQERLWFLEQIEPGGAMYHIPVTLSLRGTLAAAALERGLAEVVRRHESLRTIYPRVAGRPVQVVLPGAAFRLPLADLSALPAARRDEEARRLAAAEARRPFDLAGGAVLRGRLLRLGEREHTLAIIMHHIASDGWSMGVLIRELGSLYDAFSRGRPSPVPELPIQYPDYAVWQRRWLAGEVLEEQTAFWRQELAGVATLDLPADRPHPAVRSHRGAVRSLHSAALGRGISMLARARGATPFMALLAAFQALLGRTAGQTDVPVGTPIAGRNRGEIEGLIGFFVNTLVLRADLAGDPAFLDLLARTRERTLAAYAHQDLPFEKLVAELQPERQLGRTPLFQVLFVLMGEDAEPPPLPGLELSSIPTETGTAKFDLTVSVGELPDGGLVCRAEYDRDLFDGATVDRLLAHYANLLAAVVADPGLRLPDAALLSAAERHQLVAEWNDPAADPARPVECLHRLFAAQAALRPGAPAVTAGTTDDAGVTGATERWSYGELDRRANRIAHLLIGSGARPGDRVGVCLERSAGLVAALLGTLKAGCAYVPLDPSYPAERLAYVLGDSGVRLVVTEERLAASLLVEGKPGGGDPAGPGPGPGSSALCLDRDAGLLARQPDSDPGVEADPALPAYVIYTSGSTGRPKGVVVTHANVSRLLSATAPWFGFGPEDVWTLFHSYAFDFSVWELWGALAYGGRLVVVPYWVSRSPDAFYALLRQEKVTVLNQTPSAFRQLVRAEEEALAGARPDLDLRLVIFGGEALDPASLAPWYARRPEAGGDRRPLLVNMYGITETTVHVTWRPLRRADAGSGRSAVGRAIPDLRLHVLDPWGSWEPSAVGLPGEICVGGAGLALGYLGRPDLTAERFVPDPFGGAPGARLYRSGDLARRLPDGDIEYLGRIDAQVKVRGFRIELGEIEAALVAHPAVREAAVTLREDGPEGERRLVAYVVPAAGTEPTVPELRAHLAGRLPDHMLPAATVLLPALPLTANGKLDRRALPPPELDTTAGIAALAPSAAYVPPRTEVERLLAGIWADLLRCEHVGAQDNFFELGGDSILAIQVISRLAAAGHRLTARQVFERPTLAGLAALAVPLAAVAEEGPASGPVPLTPIQRWFLDRRPADPHHFNQAVLLEAAEPLDPACLECALAVLAAHHDALRLRFEAPPEDGREQLEDGGEQPGDGWRQRYEEVAAAASSFPLAILDLAALPAARRREAVETAAARIQESLGLAAGPLARAALFRSGPEDPAHPEHPEDPDRLLLVVHHLAVDGVSWRILLEDLESAHRRLAGGAISLQALRSLPPRTSSFGRWAARLGERAGSPAAAAEARFWLNEAAGESPLPTDLAGGRNDVASARGVAAALTEEETRALLQEAPRAYRTRPNDLLATALARALARFTGSRRLRIDLEGHGREDVFPDLDLSRTVGWFTALFPVVLDLGEEAEPGEEIKRVKEQLRAVPGHGLAYGLLRHLGTGEVAEALRALPDPEVVFNYLGQLDALVAPGRLFRPAAERSGPARSPRQVRPHLLEVTASVAGGRLQVAFTCSARRHRRATIASLAESFLVELRALVAHCLSPEAGGLTPSDVPLARLSGPALDRLLSRAGQAVAGRGAAGQTAAGRAAAGIEDVYPLSPVQAGMLFHGLHLPESGAYMEQLSLVLGSGFDPAAFERAWRRLFARHPVLRTAFAWHDLDRPLQIVYRTVDPVWESWDWTALPESEQEAQWSAFLAEDRRRGFDLARPPLSRFALARAGDHPEERWRFLWTHHHALLDGWSMPLLLGELFALYREEAGGPAAALGPVHPYRDYVAWLEGRDPAEAAESERFFRDALAGFAEPTPLGLDGGMPAAAGEAVQRSRAAVLPASQGEALRAFARRHHLTVNTLVQGAWALLLARYSGRRDVVFGAVTSGRSAPVPAIEEIVGLFINTLPARVEVDPWEKLLPWLAELQDRQVEMRGHEHTPLAEVGVWSEVPRGTPLFESILAFENYPVEQSAREQAGGALLAAEMVEQTHYPLVLAVAPGPRMMLRVGHDARRIEGAAAERLLGHLAALLAGILAGAGSTLGELPLLGEAERHQLEVEWVDAASGGPAAAQVQARHLAALGTDATHAIDAIAATDAIAAQEVPPRIHLLGRDLAPLPLGVPGEVWLGGPVVAQGHLGTPDLTAASFRPDPLAAGAGPGRLYRTGELGRRRADGRLELLGRAGLLEGGRPALARREPAGHAGASAQPRGPVARRVAGIWREILGVRRVGLGDSFFDLGGHSLTAMNLASRLRSAFGVEVPLRRLFEEPTLAGQAAEVEAALAAGRRAAAPPLRPRRAGMAAETSDLPLSYAQERLWFLDQLQPGTPLYNMPAAVRLRGVLDHAAFGAALAEVVRRHEALRATFAVRGARPVQVVATAPSRGAGAPGTSPLIDLCAFPPAPREAEVARLAGEEARRPFDLRRGPLLRTALLRTAGEEHVALLTLHHIVSDGWSMGVLIREIAALYGAFAAGRPSPLPELPVQYPDFARWQREWLRGEVLAGLLAYWRRQLAGTPPLLALPADRPRPPVQGFAGRQHLASLPPALAAAVHELCRREGVTLFMALLAVLGSLLSRYTGRRDPVVGTPVAGRTEAETEGLIGLFVNTLVLRCRIEEAEDLRALLATTRELTVDAYAHQDVPFEKLVEELAPERNLSYTPLFQVLFNLLNTPAGEIELPGLSLAPLPLTGTTAKFDLTLEARETGPQGIELSWLASRDLFDAATVARMAGHFATLLAGAVAEPGRPLGELPLLSAGERQQLREWNDSDAVLPGLDGRQPCLHDLVAAQAARDPGRLALVYEEERLTYGQLAAAANRLAHVLRRLGVGPEVPVGVCAERSPALVVALLAVLEAGGAYLPLDPDYPAERLAAMLDDAATPVVLAQPHLAGRLDGRLPGGAILVPLPGDVSTAFAGELESDPASGASPDGLAYVIFTSGSTGRPKGAMNTHRGIVNRLLWMQDAYRLAADDRVLQKTPFSFDVSVWELFWPLIVGARLVVARPGGHQDAAYLAATIAAEGITTLHFVPSMLQVFLDAPGAEGLGRGGPLRRVIASGEALPPELARRFAARIGAPLFNLYGPTEAAVDVTAWSCAADRDDVSIPIGRPVANTRIHLLDGELRPVPAGVPGELYIGGAQLARGYAGRPDLTAERFLPAPGEGAGLGARPVDPDAALGARLYRTGDLARYRADGAMEFLGRADHQVKVRGMRIELGEIEAALARHPAVREAVVLARADPATATDAAAAVPGAPRDYRLVAYLVPRDGEPPAPQDLRAFLARGLPEHMIPWAWVTLPAFPLTASGKVDRKALPAPERTAAGPRAPVAPRTPLEAVLAALWSEALGLEHVGVDDNFFELGGNSIRGAVLVNRLQRELAESVPVVTLFEAPTVAQLAALLAGAYPEAVARVWGAESLGGEGVPPPHAARSGRSGMLVPIQPRGERPAFFCLHPAGGGVLCYAELARELGEEQPFYGVQAPGLRPGEKMPASVEEVAERALAEIAGVEPEGPYLLGGWSFGGAVAYEMACQLTASGREVALLALIDTLAVAPAEAVAPDECQVLARAFADLPLSLDQLRSLTPEARLPFIVELARASGQGGHFLADFDLAEARRHLDVYQANALAQARYRPGPFPGRVTLFRAAEPPRTADATLGWGALAAEGVEVHEVPGRHETLVVQPGVRTLGRLLRRCLERVSAGERLRAAG